MSDGVFATSDKISQTPLRDVVRGRLTVGGRPTTA